jgi:motility quorum-sensing regulator/GCU-specific mRNA interferase toxin
MEKRKPHHLLTDIKTLLQAGNVKATRVASTGAAALGFDFHDMVNIVMSLESKDFYKSMTSYDDHTLWQDVYHAPTTAGDVYLKLMIYDGVLIVSFKEL